MFGWWRKSRIIVEVRQSPKNGKWYATAGVKKGRCGFDSKWQLSPEEANEKLAYVRSVVDAFFPHARVDIYPHP